MIKLCGGILILDAILSLIIVKDKRLLWQAGRLLRGAIGVYLIL